MLIIRSTLEKGIHTFRNDYKSQITKCSPWETEVQPRTSLKKKMAELMWHWQTITTPSANRPYQPMPKITVKKRNLVPMTRPNRSKLSQPRKINVRKLPKATQLNWKSSISKCLTQGAKDAVQNTSTSLAPIQGSQLIDTPSTPSPTSPAGPAKITEHSKYCAICTQLGKVCPEDFAMLSDWDEEDDQAKDKDKDQKQPKTNPSFSTTMTKLCSHQNYILQNASTAWPAKPL